MPLLIKQERTIFIPHIYQALNEKRTHSNHNNPGRISRTHSNHNNPTRCRTNAKQKGQHCFFLLLDIDFLKSVDISKASNLLSPLTVERVWPATGNQAKYLEEVFLCQFLDFHLGCIDFTFLHYVFQMFGLWQLKECDWQANKKSWRSISLPSSSIHTGCIDLTFLHCAFQMLGLLQLKECDR